MNAFTEMVVRDFPWTAGDPDVVVLEAAYRATIVTAARMAELKDGADPYQRQVAAREHARTTNAFVAAARRLGIFATETD